MTDVFTAMLHEWHDFYFMAGGAAAGLIGLMFVAISLAMPHVTDVSIENVRIFVTPSVVYFVSVLVICAVLLVPPLTPPGLALLLFGGGVFGLVMTVRYVRGLIRTAKQNRDFNLGDWLAQVVVPVVSYTLIVMAGVCMVMDQWSLSFTVLWFATLLLLLCGISNSWSLVMWIIEGRAQQDR
jgi:hypothetical protein